MSNKFYNEAANLSVYIANLDEYVKCNLVGDWVSLPIKKRNFRDFLFTIGNPEKVKILDYIDNLGLNGIEIAKDMSLEELNELGERMEDINQSEVNAFNALYEALEGDFEEALDILESEDFAFYGKMTMEEVMRRDGYYETKYGIICVE